MSRGLHADTKTAISNQVIRPVLFVKAEFDSGDIRLWSGYGPYTFNSESYQGAGELLAISEISETSSISAEGVQVSLSGVDSSILSLAMTEDYVGRPLTIYLGFFDEDESLVNTAFTLFQGYIDAMPISDDGSTCTISCSVESRLRDLFRSKLKLFSDGDQRAIDSEDAAMEYIATLQDKEITWGR